MRRRSSLFIVTVFAAGIALPLLQQLTDGLPRVEVVDNRRLAPFPPLAPTPAAVSAFPGRFESWYADHLGLRGALVAGYRRLTDWLLRSPDKVIIGREDWLYLRRGVRADIETVPLVRDWCGRFPFTERQLARWTRAITANRQWLAERGIAYLFVVTPNKMSIVPEHLPTRIDCRRGTTRLEQLKAALAARSGIELVDLRPALRRSAAGGVPVWYRTDTHWNARGVAEAYPALADRIRALVPAARRIESFDVYARGRNYGDLGRMVHLSGIDSDVIWAVTPEQARSMQAPNPFPAQSDVYGRRSSARRIDDPALPRALVFHDSFFDGAMNDFLAESFRRTVFVHHGRPDIPPELVARERPDIVIQQMVERNLLHPFYPR